METEPSGLWPFFTYFGGKWRIAPRYPAPVHDTIVEPFAGSAGYSLRYPDRRIVLCEKDPLLAALWRWLTRVNSSEILSLPNIGNDQTIDDLVGVSQEARWLVGFWLNKGMTAPCRTPSKWMREGLRPNSQWGDAIRQRIARQVECIRHWHVIEGDYTTIDVAGPATWFVDPPYQGAPGRRYRINNRKLDYRLLGDWCRSRTGQVIVCENVGATWLPFVPYLTAKGSEGANRTGTSEEAIWPAPVGA